MKLLTIALVSALTLGTATANAATYKFVAGNNSTPTQLCVAAGNNNLMKYRSNIKDTALTEQYAANKITCNGYNIATFANKYNAMRTAKHINKYKRGSVAITDLALGSEKPSNDKEIIIVTVN